MAAYIEAGLSWLLANQKGRDARAFTKNPIFAKHPEPTIKVSSPDYGEENPANLKPEHIFEGGGHIPPLQWEDVAGVAQWAVVVEDLDVPVPAPICHGAYLGIPKDVRSVATADFEPQDGQSTLLKGGFYYGKNLRGKVYVPPRPLLNHGLHRYVFNVIGLSEALDAEFVKSKPKLDQVASAIEGKIVSWGQWTAQCERRWS